MRVLLVDDSALSRLALKRIFEDAEVKSIDDFEIFEAPNGIDALEKHRTIQPDIIFMDITMPHLDGMTTLRIIRLIDTKVKVIVVTALGSHRQIAAEVLNFGADDIVAKPIDKATVIEVLVKRASSLAPKQEARL